MIRIPDPAVSPLATAGVENTGPRTQRELTVQWSAGGSRGVLRILIAALSPVSRAGCETGLPAPQWQPAETAELFAAGAPA